MEEITVFGRTKILEVQRGDADFFVNVMALFIDTVIKIHFMAYG